MSKKKGTVDWWTLAHTIAGFIAGSLDIPYYEAIILAWEIIEQGFLVRFLPEWAEPIDNVVVDMIVGYTGYKIGRFLSA